MARIYTSVFEAVAVTAVQDLLSIVAGTNTPVLLHEFGLSQTTELADAAEEILRIRLQAGFTVAGSVGTAPSMHARDVDDGAAAATVRANDTTQANSGTIVTHGVWGWNVRVPFQQIWTPELRPYFKGARRAAIQLVAAPADSITMSGYLIWSEGG